MGRSTRHVPTTESITSPLSYTWSQTPSALSNGAVRDAATAVTSSFMRPFSSSARTVSSSPTRATIRTASVGRERVSRT